MTRGRLDLLLARTIARTFGKRHKCGFDGCSFCLTLIDQPAFGRKFMGYGKVPFIHVHAGNGHSNDRLVMLLLASLVNNREVYHIHFLE